MLQAEDESWYRVSWEQNPGNAPKATRRRALPAGDYVLHGYRLLAVGEDGRMWHVSATRHDLRRIEVVAGEDLRIEIDATIHVRHRLRRNQVAMQVLGEKGAGLTIYRAGKRIPIRYRLFDPDGETVREGPMNYG
ncbi:MAG: hypothetical protein ACYTG6_09805 [Planctomycetota bacterium]|jgi:hypothetical protein